MDREQRKKLRDEKKNRKKLQSNAPSYGIFDFSKITGRGFGYYTLVFSLFFIILGLFVWGVNFLFVGKSLVESGDGILQHSLSLAYYGQYLRDIFVNLFKNHKLVLPMFDFNLGFGADIIQTLNYYCIGEPLNILSVFVPQAYTEILYSILIIVRFYLCGLSFSLFAWNKTEDKFGVLLGAISYSFCGFALQLGMRHPFFLTGMIYLPILLMCIDGVLQNRKMKKFSYEQLFILTIFLSAVSNFYTFYMCCCLMIVYAAVRYFVACKPFKFKHLLITLGKFALFSVIGVCMAAPILLPQILSMVQNSRTTADVYIGVFQPLTYYFNLLKCPTDVNSLVTDMILGFSSVSLFAFAAVLSKKDKKLRDVKILSIIALIFMVFPFFGHVLNGMSYVSNRWAFAVALIPSYCIAKIYPELITLTKKETCKTALILTIYTLVGVIFTRTISTNNMFVVALMFICLVCLLLVNLGYIKTNTFKHFLVWDLAICICFNSIAVFGINRGNFAANFIDIGTVYDYQKDGDPGALIDQLGDKSFYRVANYTDTGANNSPLINGYSATRFYFSTTNPVVADFIGEMELATPYSHLYSNMMNRTILEKISGVKYVVTKRGAKVNGFSEKLGKAELENRSFLDSSAKNVTYGYNNDYADDPATTKVDVYQADGFLPMGYTYDSYIAREDYDKLTSVQKQNALLQGAVIEKSDNVKRIQPDNSDVDVEKLNLESYEGIEVDGEKIIAKKPYATLTFSVPHNSADEAYLTIKNIHWNAASSYEPIDETLKTAKKEDNATVSFYSRVNLFFKKLYETLPQKTDITFSMNGRKTSFTYFSEKWLRYAGKHDFSMCLTNRNESKNETDTVKLTLQQPGTYTFDDIYIQYQSLGHVEEKIKEMDKDTLKDVSIEANSVYGDITLTEPKILCTQIPYSSGWSVYVDGEPAELLKCNTMYCATELSAGAHTVQFLYKTPLSNVSFSAFIIATAAFVAVGFILQKNKKHEDKKNTVTTSE